MHVRRARGFKTAHVGELSEDVLDEPLSSARRQISAGLEPGVVAIECFGSDAWCPIG